MAAAENPHNSTNVGTAAQLRPPFCGPELLEFDQSPVEKSTMAAAFCPSVGLLRAWSARLSDPAWHALGKAEAGWSDEALKEAAVDAKDVHHR